MGQLRDRGVSGPEAAKAAAAWRDTVRSTSVGQPSHAGEKVVIPGEPRPEPTRPPPKRQRLTPPVLHAPGPWHKEQQAKYLAKQRAADVKATQAQGLKPANEEHPEGVWRVYLQAGRASTLHREVHPEDEGALKKLVLLPMQRYADSLGAKLASWRRWEAWVAALLTLPSAVRRGAGRSGLALPTRPVPCLRRRLGPHAVSQVSPSSLRPPPPPGRRPGRQPVAASHRRGAEHAAATRVRPQRLAAAGGARGGRAGIRRRRRRRARRARARDGGRRRRRVG